jgi:serine/threonine protein phosphatase 1
MTLKIASIPDGIDVFAIGDVHGRADLLESLIGYIELGKELGVEDPFAIVFLGDLIDRGPDSRKAVELALAAVDRHPGSAIIMGNHEEFMRDVIWGSTPGYAWDSWYHEGGAKTLRSFGVDSREPVSKIAETLRQDALIRKLFDTVVDIAEDDLRIYAHAGIQPHVPLEEQGGVDIRWIREDFLFSRVDHGRTVVHGHTITRSELPEVRSNRIALDTGSFATGKLTTARFGRDGSTHFFMAEAKEDRIRIGPVEPALGA